MLQVSDHALWKDWLSSSVFCGPCVCLSPPCPCLRQTFLAEEVSISLIWNVGSLIVIWNLSLKLFAQRRNASPQTKLLIGLIPISSYVQSWSFPEKFQIHYKFCFLAPHEFLWIWIWTFWSCIHFCTQIFACHFIQVKVFTDSILLAWFSPHWGN